VCYLHTRSGHRRRSNRPTGLAARLSVAPVERMNDRRRQALREGTRRLRLARPDSASALNRNPAGRG